MNRARKIEMLASLNVILRLATHKARFFYPDVDSDTLLHREWHRWLDVPIDSLGGEVGWGGGRGTGDGNQNTCATGLTYSCGALGSNTGTVYRATAPAGTGNQTYRPLATTVKQKLLRLQIRLVTFVNEFRDNEVAGCHRPTQSGSKLKVP